MLELKFNIYHRTVEIYPERLQSLVLSLVYGLGITFAALTEEFLISLPEIQ